MLPVTVIDENPDHLPSVKSTAMPSVVDGNADTAQPGVIEVKIAGAVVRIDGNADLPTLRALLGMLRP